MKWLITGGCGFIGLNLIKSLISEGGHYIRIVDNLSVGSREDLSKVCEYRELALNDIIFQPSVLSPQSSVLNNQYKSVELIVADILDADSALNVARGVDVIVHLAANSGVALSVEDPRSDCMNNVLGTLNYLEAARQQKVKRFIFASSGAPVGECPPPIHEECVARPVSPYGASKLAGEAYCSAYFRTYGIETVALRFGNVYGPMSGQKSSVVAKFIKQAISGHPLEIYGDGLQTRDFICVADLVRAIRLAAGVEKIGGEIFQIATNMETSVKALTQKMLKVFEQYKIQDVTVNYGTARLGDVRSNYSDTSKAARILGWRPEIDLDAGLKSTVQWFLDASNISPS